MTPPGNGLGDTERDRLFALLPAVYRLRDAEQGGPLRALLAVIQAEFDRVDADTARLYDDWFIETCEEWIVPYLGDLLGVRGLPPPPSPERGGGAAAFSRRAYVANTLAYRRRKGTAGVLEELARDVTGWNAHAVEFWQTLAVTQHVNHVRPAALATVDLRDANALELIDTPFERAAGRTLEVRHIDNRRGKYNLPNVGLFLWRLQSYAVSRATPRVAPGVAGSGFYTFHPAGLSAPLFNRPRAETDIAALSTELNVPDRLRRRALAEELAAPADEARAGFLDPDGPPAFQVFLAVTPAVATPVAVPRERVAVCHLGDLPAGGWRRPPAGKDVAVDPVLGRLSLPAGVTPDRIQVTYAYGFGGDVGGGPYDRSASVARWRDRERRITWQAGVTQDPTVLAFSTTEAPLFRTVRAAVGAWNTHVGAHPDAFGVIAVTDSGTYADALTGPDRLAAPAAARLALVAADWPRFDAPGLPPAQLGRRLGELVPVGKRPHVLGDVEVAGGGEVIVDGLLVEGRLTVPPGDLARLTVNHCTFVPRAGGVTIQAAAGAGLANDRLVVTLYRSVSGPVTVADSVRRLDVAHSVLDHGTATAMVTAVALTAPEAELESVTVLGRSIVRELTSSNTIFGAPVDVARRQQGCVRFSYVPTGSRTPRRYRCRPETDAEAERVVPVWSSVRWGEPGYAQLTSGCAGEVARGAEDENEMGVFRTVQQASRVAALREALNEYLRFGLEAGIFFVE